MSKRKAVNPFHALRDQSPEAVRAEMDSQWEHARVEYAMNQLGINSKWKRKLSSLAVSRQGGFRYTFALLEELFPDFPIRLGCDRLSTRIARFRDRETGKMVEQERPAEPLHRREEAFHPEWFKNFRKLPFIAPYVELFESLPEAAARKPVGLIFPRKGLKQGMVVHNGDPYDFVKPGSGCHLYMGSGRKPMSLLVQPFQFMLQQIKEAHDWKPSGAD